METYLFIALYIIGLIECLDIGYFFAKWDMYKKIKYMNLDNRTQITEDLYTNICFYLLPYERLDKLSNKLPLNYLLNRKIKCHLKNKTYSNENILELLERIKTLKWEDIKNTQFQSKE